MSVLIVLTNVPNFDEGRSMAYNLVSKKLCACVNITSKCHSIYYWQDKIEEAEEYTLLIKTNTDKYAELEQEIKALHKYEIPEIIAIDVIKGLYDYLNWISHVVD